MDEEKSACERVQKLLSERGIEWQSIDDLSNDVVVWSDASGNRYSCRNGFTFKGPDGTVIAGGLTPEQVVAATTCGIVRCKDCVHFTANEEFWVGPPNARFLAATSDSCDFWADTKTKVDPMGFCSNGERRADERREVTD